MDLWTVITSICCWSPPSSTRRAGAGPLWTGGARLPATGGWDALHGHESTRGDAPVNAGSAAVVRLNKGDFIGRDALAATSRRALREIRCWSL